MSTFNVGFVIVPDLTQLDFTGPLQVLSRLPGSATHIVAKSMAPVPSDCNLGLMPCLVTNYAQGAKWQTAPIGPALTKIVDPTAAQKIADINPPDDAKDANKKLADGLNAMADSFEEIGKETKGSSTDPTKLLPKINALTTTEGIKQVTAAINDLKAKGYNVSN